MIERATCRPITLALVLACAPLASASADTFEARASGAQRIAEVEDLVWALTASCDLDDDVHRRQCQQIRDRRASALQGATLLVDADPAALQIGRWDPAKKSVSIRLSSCVRCAGVAVDRKTWYVIGAGPARFEGGTVRPAMLHDSARVFPDEAAATAWRKPLTKLGIELIVKLPKKPRTQVAGKDALRLDVVGWRVVNRCDGSIVVADPASGPVAADKQACK